MSESLNTLGKIIVSGNLELLLYVTSGFDESYRQNPVREIVYTLNSNEQFPFLSNSLRRSVNKLPSLHLLEVKTESNQDETNPITNFLPTSNVRYLFEYLLTLKIDIMTEQDCEKYVYIHIFLLTNFIMDLWVINFLLCITCIYQ